MRTRQVSTKGGNNKSLGRWGVSEVTLRNKWVIKKKISDSVVKREDAGQNDQCITCTARNKQNAKTN